MANKPELIIQDFGGYHNKDLESTSARLIKGGSWKKQRIAVILPSASMISARVALSHWNLMFPPNQAVVRLLALGQEVGDAYNNAIENILNDPVLKDFEYILTLEHDNAPPPDAVIKMIEDFEAHPELSCIGALYYTKGYNGVAQCWGDINDPIQNYRPVPPRTDGGLLETWGTGMGCNLFKLSMFKDPKLRKPWFVTQTKNGLATQDLYFWGDAKKYGYRCAIDCSIKCGHWDEENQIMW